MDEEKIRQIVRDEIMKQHTSVQGVSISNHRHNRVDSLPINSFDINTSNPQGFVFGTISKDYANFFYDPVTNELSIQENAAVSNMGFDISNFEHITIDAVGVSGFSITEWLSASSTILSTVDDTIDTTTSELAVDGFTFTATGNFALELPDTTKPPAIAGMLAFESATGNFQASEVTGTWKYVPTSSGATTGAVVPAGTVALTINGITYNILHT